MRRGGDGTWAGTAVLLLSSCLASFSDSPRLFTRFATYSSVDPTNRVDVDVFFDSLRLLLSSRAFLYTSLSACAYVACPRSYDIAPWDLGLRPLAILRAFSPSLPHTQSTQMSHVSQFK